MIWVGRTVPKYRREQKVLRGRDGLPTKEFQNGWIGKETKKSGKLRMIWTAWRSYNEELSPSCIRLDWMDAQEEEEERPTLEELTIIIKN